MLYAMQNFARTAKTEIKAFFVDNKAVAVIEFALLLPFMAILYLGSIEISFLIAIDRRVTATSSTIGDLVARADVIDLEDAENIFKVSDSLFSPYDPTPAEVRVTSIVDDGGTAKVEWSQAQNTAPYPAGSSITVDAGVLPAGGSVIYAEVSYRYTQGFGYLLQNGSEIKDDFYLRPRKNDKVLWIGPGGPNGSGGTDDDD
ncbi:MAG: TadE/TadG family type IV pilus assembly protein [Pseudomonadota bacterium]